MNKHILDEIIEKIGPSNYFEIKDFMNILNLSYEDSMAIIKEGVEKKLMIETLTDREYAFSDLAIDKYQPEVFNEFSRFISDNFSISDRKHIKLNAEETELKDTVLMNLAMGTKEKRQTASELIVIHIENNNSIKTTRDDKASEVWIYKEGIYVPEGKTYIKEFCRKILGAAYTGQFIGDVIAKVEADTQIEPKEFFNQNYLEEVPVENGILNIVTKKLSPFNQRKIFFNKLPIYYDPSAKCPLITKHFETVLKDKEDAKILFELFGYLLWKENKLEKAFMFIGSGRNGKSKTLELIKKFVGINNCSALPLNAMNSESFSLSELFGKMANLAGDLSYTDLKETGTLKQLIGRDEIQSKRKFKSDLNFVNYSKLLFACNELPKIYDMTDGFWTKWILLEFPYKFITQKEYDELPEQERTSKKIIDTEIIEKISSPEELSGLLNEALKSLDNVLEQKEFSYSHSTNEVKEMWIRQSDSFMAFCMDNLEEDYDCKVSKKVLRKHYFNYCKQYRLRSSSDKSIKITLENMFGVIESRDGNMGDFQWGGIKFKDNSKDSKGISTNIGKSNSTIGSNTIAILAIQEKKAQILNFLKENEQKMLSIEELKELEPNEKDLMEIIKSLEEKGLIFSPKDYNWRYLG